MATTLDSVRRMDGILEDLLEKASTIKPAAKLNPALTQSDFIDTIDEIKNEESRHHPLVEASFRSVFYKALSSASIHDASFTKIWNILDFCSIFADNELCDPALPFLLIEELLDSQTIEGCRMVFDYLESRRERLLAKSPDKKKNHILRFCNELLRRLSRTEDTVFCGEVFIFLYQSFPLNDKSSVNLRGEYHIGNVTTFDGASGVESIETAGKMDLDADSGKGSDKRPSSTIDSQQTDEAKRPKTVTFDTEMAGTGSAPDINALYPIFWSLQQDFADPTRLFKAENFDSFKNGLDATIAKFKAVKTSEDNKRGPKRKRGEGGDDLSTVFNPKYLTSKDLFELEISELAFRRHILVQALILIDFLLSLTPRAKDKLSELVTNRNASVWYPHTLSTEDMKWAQDAKATIANYLQEGPEGKFYYRMVDTVLSRDKNWVKWKAEGCPTFELPPLSPEEFIRAKSEIERVWKPSRTRANPHGAPNLGFLSDAEGLSGLEELKVKNRYTTPTAESFKEKIKQSDLEIEFAMDDEDRQAALDAKASKTWRALRLASTSRLNIFDRIDDWQNINVLFTEADGDKLKVESMGDSSDGKVGDTPSKGDGNAAETASTP